MLVPRSRQRESGTSCSVVANFFQLSAQKICHPRSGDIEQVQRMPAHMHFITHLAHIRKKEADSMQALLKVRTTSKSFAQFVWTAYLKFLNNSVPASTRSFQRIMLHKSRVRNSDLRICLRKNVIKFPDFPLKCATL